MYGVPLDLDNPEDYRPTPWEIYTYDSNDNSDRTHRDNSTIFKDHWNTPCSYVIDSMARRIQITERVSNDELQSRVTHFHYDILGRLLKINDTEGRIASEYVYDDSPESRPIIVKEMDARTKSIVFNAAGNIIEEQDSNNSVIVTAYDALNRATKVWARNNNSQPFLLRERTIYGDDEENSGLTHDNAAELNLLGRMYKQYDQSGLISFVPDPLNNKSRPYDFKGNVLEKTRQTISDKIIIGSIDFDSSGEHLTPFEFDWEHSINSFSDENLLDPTIYRVSQKYNALNLPTSIAYPSDTTGIRQIASLTYNTRGARLSKIR